LNRRRRRSRRARAQAGKRPDQGAGGARFPPSES
jgi:hypothetical protein